MNEQLVFGLFALYVVFVSLYGILSGRSDTRLAFVRKAWGRIHGLSIYFCVHVGLPMLVGIVFICLGSANFHVPGNGLARQDVFDTLPEINWQVLPDTAEQAPRPEPTIPICA